MSNGKRLIVRRTTEGHHSLCLQHFYLEFRYEIRAILVLIGLLAIPCRAGTSCNFSSNRLNALERPFPCRRAGSLRPAGGHDKRGARVRTKHHTYDGVFSMECGALNYR